jgi:hypothetical protein
VAVPWAGRTGRTIVIEGIPRRGEQELAGEFDLVARELVPTSAPKS